MRTTGDREETIDDLRCIPRRVRNLLVELKRERERELCTRQHVTVPRNALLGYRGKKSMKPPPLSFTPPLRSPPRTVRGPLQRRRGSIRFLAAPCDARLVPKIRAPSRSFATLGSVERRVKLVNGRGGLSRITRSRLRAELHAARLRVDLALGIALDGAAGISRARAREA